MKNYIKQYLLFSIFVSILIGCKENNNIEITDNTTIERQTGTNSQTPILTESTTSTTTIDKNPTNHEEILDLQTQKQSNETQKNNINSIIPGGWYILEHRFKGELAIAEGDLNKDGILDIATVIEKTVFDQSTPPRSLLIAFGNKDSTYSTSIIADKVILEADAGGVWGDPFDSLIIDRGSVVVSDYGGSNWRWYNKYRFRYQDNDWFLIGATMGNYHNVVKTIDEADEDDINLLTGDYIKRRTDENGKTTIEKGNRGKKELIKLKEFNLDNM